MTEFLDHLVAFRTDVRRRMYEPVFGDDWDRAGCGYVTTHIQRHFGLEIHSGCYVDEDGLHFEHRWNVSPSGDRVLDATADQFGEPGRGIRLTAVDDPRYADGCECGGIAIAKILPDGSGAWLDAVTDELATDEGDSGLTVGAVLKAALEDNTPKTVGLMFDPEGLCIFGGAAVALGMDPIVGGDALFETLNRLPAIQPDQVPVGLVVTGRKPRLGDLLMAANDETDLPKREIAARLLAKLPREILQADLPLHPYPSPFPTSPIDRQETTR